MIAHADPLPFQMSVGTHEIVFRNRLLRLVHDLRRGGELAVAQVRFGSNENLLVAPMYSAIGIFENGGYHLYRSDRLPAQLLEAEGAAGGETCCFRCLQRLADENGSVLDGVSIVKTVTAHAWGYETQRLEFRLDHRIAPVGQVQVAAMLIHPAMDCCAVREATVQSGALDNSNKVRDYRLLTRGFTRADMPVQLAHWLPLSVLLFRRGCDGIELALDDDLAAWDCLVTGAAYHQQTYITYQNPPAEGYLVRLCPADSTAGKQTLEPGVHTLGFRLSLPMVKEHMVPLRPGSGSLLHFERPFAERWPGRAEISDWKAAGVTLMRLHNDGDCYGNGIFWRDAAYPPYPPEEMAKMRDFLKRANAAGIAVAPYFSLREFHPEAPEYRENAAAWSLRTEPDGPELVNYAAHGVFGTQMCLRTNWLEKRRASIDQALARHPFRGVYYDWCAGAECCNRQHGRRHWDNDEVQELLEWSYRRVGAEGEVYLHVTGQPSLAAENLASLVLTEESGYARLTPQMFTPHVHFMNIAPRQICDMLSSHAAAADRRKLALAALLHHATVSSVHPDYLAFYRALTWRDKVSRYCRHSAPGENLAETNQPLVGMALYWSDAEILAVAANLDDVPHETVWRIASALNPETAEGRIELAPLELRVFTIPRR